LHCSAHSSFEGKGNAGGVLEDEEEEDDEDEEGGEEEGKEEEEHEEVHGDAGGKKKSQGKKKKEDTEGLSAAAQLLSKLWRKRRHGIVQFDLASNEPMRLWRSSAEASRTLGINKGNLSKCISGKYRSSGGYGWRSATPKDFELFEPASNKDVS
jgi:hypothetical protein